MNKQDIIRLIESDKWMMELLATVKKLNLPDWYIGAGFIRSKVWDTLHGYTKRTPISDIDVIYLDMNDFTVEEAMKESTKTEISYEEKLKELMPGINWTVTNQARMHLFHEDRPYTSSEEALSQWVETATCVGVRIDENNNLILSAPRGIDDLVNLVLRPVNIVKKDSELFYRRIEDKKWLEKWPKLKIVT